MNLMGQASCNNLIGIGELEGHYSTYCRTMRILVREGKSMEQVQRSLCWNRLTILHNCLPAQYRGPGQLYVQMKREISA